MQDFFVTRRLRLWFSVLAVLLAVVLAGCDNPPEDSPADEVQQRLVGTWLREYDEEGAHIRRVLVLESGGKFHEMSTVLAPGTQEKQESQAEGEWLFDGTNLKRRYASINGKPVSAPIMPFATFEISFPSRSEFVGVDHIHKREVHYERVVEGTEP